MVVQDLLISIGWVALWIVIGGLAAYVISKIARIILDNTVEVWLEKRKLGQDLKEMGLPISSILSGFIGVAIFIFFLQQAIATGFVGSSVVNLMLLLLSYAEAVVVFVGLLTAGLLLVDFLSDYLYRLAKEYREDIADVLRLVLYVGLLWLVLYVGLSDVLGLSRVLTVSLIVGFTSLAIGFALTSMIEERLKEKTFADFAPYARYYLLGIFVLVSVFVMFSSSVTNLDKLIEIFAWGFVAVFVIAALPFVVKALRQLY